MPGNDVEAYCLLCECKYEERSTTTIKVTAPCDTTPSWAQLGGCWRGAQQGTTKLSQLTPHGSAGGTVSESGTLLALRRRQMGAQSPCEVVEAQLGLGAHPVGLLSRAACL